jgi:hypothetical protein
LKIRTPRIHILLAALALIALQGTARAQAPVALDFTDLAGALLPIGEGSDEGLNPTLRRTEGSSACAVLALDIQPGEEDAVGGGRDIVRTVTRSRPKWRFSGRVHTSPGGPLTGKAVEAYAAPALQQEGRP